MLFKNLKIEGWRQYKNIDIEFHPRLTIITGANGAGKTTLLGVLNQHFGGIALQLVGVPNLVSGTLRYFSSTWGPVKTPLTTNMHLGPNGPVHMPLAPNPSLSNIGTIEYDNGISSQINIPVSVGQVYNFQFSSQQPVKGAGISSHRPIFKYEPVASIPTNVSTKGQIYQNYRNSFIVRWQGGQTNNKTETYHIKEALISLSAFGPGNAVIQQNTEALNLLRGFENILATVLPKTLGFRAIAVRMPEVVLITDTGEFPIDAVSGGVASIIDLAWQIYMYESNGEPFVITIDEPENHLHPEIQKSVLVNMVNAFPSCQFIVSTHSPFIIGSIRDSNAYALRYDENNKVYSTLLDTIDKAGTANEILREVLGLEDTMPNWVDDKIGEIINRYKGIGINKENVASFKQALADAGLGKYVPSSLIKLVEEYKSEGTEND
jgi:AAA domain, putative AbiEii toxin, Type IV TA system/AAA domain